MIDYIQLEKEAPEGWFSRFDMEVLVPYVQRIPERGVYLEIGTHKGRSLWIARKFAKKSVEVCGVDIQPDPKIKGTIFTLGESIQVANNMLPHVKRIDLLFIDGDHSYEGCKADIESWYPFIKNGGIMLFHDCDETSVGVMRAITEFVHTHRKEIEEFRLYKRTDKNTSMALVRLKS